MSKFKSRCATRIAGALQHIDHRGKGRERISLSGRAWWHDHAKLLHKEVGISLVSVYRILRICKDAEKAPVASPVTRKVSA